MLVATPYRRNEKAIAREIMRERAGGAHLDNHRSVVRYEKRQRDILWVAGCLFYRKIFP